MTGTLILWAVSALLLHVAVRFTGPVDPERGTYLNAIFTTAILQLVGFAVGALDSVLLSLGWPVVWLFILKSMYGIGWMRAIGIWIVIALAMFALMAFILLPFGLIGAGFALLAA